MSTTPGWPFAYPMPVASATLMAATAGLADRIPAAQLVIFPELGHLLCWQDPDGFVDAVTTFLLASDEKH